MHFLCELQRYVWGDWLSDMDVKSEFVAFIIAHCHVKLAYVSLALLTKSNVIWWIKRGNIYIKPIHWSNYKKAFHRNLIKYCIYHDLHSNSNNYKVVKTLWK